jgi:hypothetical protein
LTERKRKRNFAKEQTQMYFRLAKGRKYSLHNFVVEKTNERALVKDHSEKKVIVIRFVSELPKKYNIFFQKSVVTQFILLVALGSN